MKRRKVVYASRSRDDLLNVYDWIARVAGERTAVMYVRRIEAYCAALDVGSERGRPRDDVQPGLRIVGFERRVTIAFAVDEDRVTILRIFYGGRNWEELL